MRNLFKQVQGWFVATTLVEAGVMETEEPDRSARRLSPAIVQKLSLAIAELPLPQVHQIQLRSQIDQAVTQWRSDPKAPNHLVIIADPTEPLEKYRRWVLDQPDWASVALLSDWHRRPQDYTTIADKLAQAIETAQAAGEPGQLVVLPSLDQCFLRCADGLAAIDYLRDAIAGDRHHFWVLSCNQWAWQYLDSVCHTRAYFQQTLTIPKLDGWALRRWLLPLNANVEYPFATAEQVQPAPKPPQQSDSETAEAWASELEEQYFTALATAAGGISQVAAALWLTSLCHQESEKTAETAAQETVESREYHSVVLKDLAFPELPSLTADDRYLLFSLVLHRSIDISDLALTLGDSLEQVTSQAWPLLQQDVIAIAPLGYQLNPAYYLLVRANLRRNNFVVD
ncbi:MAG: hypothetical protein HC886_00255 [Leptolyngbyaceae cyanobacterium SM1_1_3]|nr:hypothetical protein [Leptolyngbyaceae cyanobacterium SM1_1_3]NJM84745.1 hypothetical protein [Leptolyngbyaceae cyanobacterium RM2_2_21]NJN01989.1 hypothetical protein [Leptolyngbyaceae cyanobacterium RM1_1_2]NJO10116.1 hypothetical protein [Leptolyngbyaceae cyanobacterium SL_1_1]